MAYTPNLIRGQNKVNADKMIEERILQDYNQNGKGGKKYKFTRGILPGLYASVFPFLTQPVPKEDKEMLVRDLWEICKWMNEVMDDYRKKGWEIDISEFAFNFRSHIFSEQKSGLEEYWYDRLNGEREITVGEVKSGEFARDQLIRKLNRHKQV